MVAKSEEVKGLVYEAVRNRAMAYTFRGDCRAGYTYTCVIWMIKSILRDGDRMRIHFRDDRTIDSIEFDNGEQADEFESALRQKMFDWAWQDSAKALGLNNDLLAKELSEQFNRLGEEE